MMDGEGNWPAFESLPTLTKSDLRSVTILEGLTSCLWYAERGTTRQSQSRGPISPCFLDCSHLILALRVEPPPSLAFLLSEVEIQFCFPSPGWLCNSSPLPSLAVSQRAKLGKGL